MIGKENQSLGNNVWIVEINDAEEQDVLALLRFKDIENANKIQNFYISLVSNIFVP